MKINTIIKVHDYLDNLQEVGKVISFASMVRVAEDLNEGKKLQGLEMGILYTKIPNSIKKEIIDPYISIKNNEARIGLRVLDSKENLRRNDLIKKINMYNLRKEVEIQSTDYKVFVSNENIETSNTFTDKRFLNKEIRRIYCKDKSILKTIYNRDFYDFLRFKNCILEGPSEIEPNMTLPSEINLDLLGGISFDKGCFIGQEVNARIKWKGLVKKKYVPIKFKNTDLSLLKFDKTKDRRILLNDIEIGEIVSITENTNDNYHYGIAKIKLSQLYLFENDNNLKCDFSHYKVSVIFPKYMLPLPKKI